jgi:hypothetical protein
VLTVSLVAVVVVVIILHWNVTRDMVALSQQQFPPSLRSDSTSKGKRNASLLSKGECPAAVQRARGLFRNSDAQQRRGGGGGGDRSLFEDVVLVTAANSGYYDMLQNWQYLAARQELKWVVVAMDEPLYGKLMLGSEPPRVVPTAAEYAVSETVTFRTRGFNTLSCNKLRSVLRIVEACDVDVVFSDSDNVFLRNPFEHDLGRMILSDRYDYIYQVNVFDGVDGPRQHSCLQRGKRVDEGNTGFYYISRNSDTVKQVIRDALDACSQPDNELDDQTLFWNEMRKRNNTRHCDAAEVDSLLEQQQQQVSSRIKETTTTANNNATASLCCLDPYYYPTGMQNLPKTMITFHANFARGKERKVKKLMRVRGGWNPFHISYSDCRFPWIAHIKARIPVNMQTCLV